MGGGGGLISGGDYKRQFTVSFTCMVYIMGGFTLVVDLGVGCSLRCDEPFFETKLRELKAERKTERQRKTTFIKHLSNRKRFPCLHSLI